jgi:protein-S-isoprenylcysteine O-methyltransferase Ste14
MELKMKPYKPLEFKVIGFYKFVRHPLYFGIIVGLWSAPVMSMSHITTAIVLTGYIVIGATLEEKDLTKEFGENYKAYKRRTPMLLPFLKKGDR